ncbi:MAG: DUF2605 domain-containing protein [Cyanobacteriota bacterium]|nr:DUF2605 domain-containing protein [Cyanobacteriota bacterium]
MTQAEMLREILSPLIEDYRYWFGRSRQLLEKDNLGIISPEGQVELRRRLEQAEGELQTATTLYELSDNEVGIDPALMAKWHRLLMECAELGRRYYQLNPPSDP